MSLLLIILVFSSAFALFVWWNVGDVPDQNKWPSISEDEFIRRCPPGVDPERALKVRRIIAEQLGVDYDRVYPEQRFVEDLKCD